MYKLDENEINEIIDQIINRFTTYLGTKDRDIEKAKTGLKTFIKVLYEDNAGYDE